MKKYNHIKHEERKVIELLINKGFGVRYIANVLNRSPSTISKEINRNKVNNVYITSKANHKSYVRRKYSKRQCLKVVSNRFIENMVRDKLNIKWSPDEISGYLKEVYNIRCSSKAIYKYIKFRCLEHLLFWSWNNKKSGPKYTKNNKLNDDRRYIEERSKNVLITDWEMDFIVSRESNYVLLVLVNRLTRYTVLEILENRKHITVSNVLSKLSKLYPIKTITTDNDIAFNNWKQLEYILHCKIYFCHPYHSWEKGLVENTNRWIRCFIPKRKDIKLVTNRDINNINSFINYKPRKVNGFIPSYVLQYHYVSVEG